MTGECDLGQAPHPIKGEEKKQGASGEVNMLKGEPLQQLCLICFFNLCSYRF